MITKVPRNFDKDSIENAFANVQMTKGSRRIKKYFDALKKEVTEKKRIFFMSMAKVGEYSNQKKRDIELIDQRSTYWRRDVNASQEPDMKMIKTNIEKVLTKRYDTEDDDDFKEDFKHFGDHFKKVFETKLDFLTKVFRLFIEDSFKTNLGKNYLEPIKKRVEAE